MATAFPQPLSTHEHELLPASSAAYVHASRVPSHAALLSATRPGSEELVVMAICSVKPE